MILISAVYIKIKNKILFEALPRYSHLLLEICVFLFFFLNINLKNLVIIRLCF